MPVSVTLSELFERAMGDYPAARATGRFGVASPFWPLVGNLRGALQAAPVVTGSRMMRVGVSFGRGAWAEVPTLAVMDTRETENQTSGVYMVYLLAADGSSISLTLNQGSGDVILDQRGKAEAVLRQRAARIRPRVLTPALVAAGFSADPPDLRATGPLPRAYAAGAIVGKIYARAAVPADERLHADLDALARVYRSGVPYRL